MESFKVALWGRPSVYLLPLFIRIAISIYFAWQRKASRIQLIFMSNTPFRPVVDAFSLRLCRRRPATRRMGFPEAYLTYSPRKSLHLDEGSSSSAVNSRRGDRKVLRDGRRTVDASHHCRRLGYRSCHIWWLRGPILKFMEAVATMPPVRST